MAGFVDDFEDGRCFPNALVDLMLVVGLDDNSGLILVGDQDENDLSLEDVFLKQYEPQVLSAASSNTMMHFFPHPRQDYEYPGLKPEILTKDKYISRRTASKSFENMHPSRFGKAFYVSKNSGVSPMSVTRHMSVRGTKMKKNKMATIPEFPVSEEVIKSITTFCYPDGMKVYPVSQESFVHFLVLTDIMGNKTFATCLTFYRPYIMEKGEKSKIWMSLDPSEDNLERQQIRCYIPHCCVLISKYPYFTVMKDALSFIVSKTEEEQFDFYTHIKFVIYRLTMTPVPLAGRLALEVDIGAESIFLFPPEKADKPVIDIPLHLVFLCFHSDEILKILAAILLEERIVFISSSYALLTTVMQSFLYFILPFEWRYSFVPILTIEALELLEAPGTFMMGCHSMHRKEVEQIQGIVVVDIDEGAININPVEEMATSNTDNITSLHDIPDIPEESAKLFRKVCQKAKYQHDLVALQRPECFNSNLRRLREKIKFHQLNSDITAGCLNLMVNLYRGVISEIRLDHQRFNRSGFLDSVQTSDRKFYEKVMNTDMFKIFLKDRMSAKTDHWSQLEVLTRPQVKKAGGTADNKLANRRAQLKKQVSVTFLPGLVSKKDTIILKLPPIERSLHTYIKKSIQTITDDYQKSNDLQDRASYLYLRATYYSAQNRHKEAIDDLTRLAEIDMSLVPDHMASLAFTRISEGEQIEIRSKPGVQQLTELLHLDKDQAHSPREHHRFEEPIELPQHDLNFEEFHKVVSLLEMTQDMETMMRLFQALELSQQNGYDKVDMNTFQTFVHCYQENIEHCAVVDHSFLHPDEYVLKLSGLCKTDAGSGRIVMTNKRLLFMKDGSREAVEVIKVRNITKVEKKQLKSFFKSIDVLRVYGKEDAKFTSWLKGDTNHWLMLLKELHAGKVVSMGTKDILAASKAANIVQLVDAYLKSSEDEETTHHENPFEVAKQLCYFTKYMEEKRHELPRETLETLLNRIDPCQGEAHRHTVQSILYTAGDPTLHILPRLWCGMGDGKIKVFDGMTWNLEPQYIQTKNAVMCLADLGNGQIWAGSMYIYIVDAQTIHCNRAPLTDHKDAVVSIVVAENGRYVYSASADGDILKWDVATITVVHRCKEIIKQLKTLKFYNGFLWCGTWHAIFKLDVNGTILNTFPMDKISGEVFSFHITGDNQIWAGQRRSGSIFVLDGDKGDQLAKIDLDNSAGISAMVQEENKIWVGCRTGAIHIINTDGKKVVKVLQAHDDAVRSLCCAQDRFIISGAGSRDGRIAMWSLRETKTDSGRYLLED